MSNAELTQVDESALFSAIAEGNLMKLSTPQKLAYYNRRCSDLGLNPLNQPFQWLVLNGKLTLYANRQCTEELRKLHGVSIYKMEKEKFDDCYVVTAYARDKTGREDSSTGAVTLGTLKGEALANQLMKAETKAKRRVTLSICGLGMLDETEVQTIPGAQVVNPTSGATLEEDAKLLDKANISNIAKAEGWTIIEGRITGLKEAKGHLWFDLAGVTCAGDPKLLHDLEKVELGDEASFACVEQTAGKKKFWAIQEVGVVLKPTLEQKLEASVEHVEAQKAKGKEGELFKADDSDVPF